MVVRSCANDVVASIGFQRYHGIPIVAYRLTHVEVIAAFYMVTVGATLFHGPRHASQIGRPQTDAASDGAATDAERGRGNVVVGVGIGHTHLMDEAAIGGDHEPDEVFLSGDGFIVG